MFDAIRTVPAIYGPERREGAGAGLSVSVLLHGLLLGGLLAAALLAVPPIEPPHGAFVIWEIDPHGPDPDRGGGEGDRNEAPALVRRGEEDASDEMEGRLALREPIEEIADPVPPPETLPDPKPEQPREETRPDGSGGEAGTATKGHPLGAPLGAATGSLGGDPLGRGGGGGGPGPGGTGPGRGPGGGGTERIYDGSLHRPVLLEKVEPVYPPLAIRARRQGLVVLDVVIGADGRIRDVRLVRSEPLLDEAAIDAVRRWRYEPARIDGRAVAVALRVEVSFVLR